MSGPGTAGAVAELWRFPVKSMAGESVVESDVDAAGLRGDRAFALVDCEAGKVVSAKSVRLFPDILECRAAYLEPPQVGQALPPVRITLPNGISIIGGEGTSGEGAADRMLSAHFGRHVALAQSAPTDSTIELRHPDAKSSFFDAFPFSVITTSTLDRLHELRPESRIDPRRFRMNAIVATEGVGFRESAWTGRTLSIGDAVRLTLVMPDPRCVMTTLAQDDLPKDAAILRTLVEHNCLVVGDGGRLPCAGVYAEVAVGGTIRVGDPVALS